MIPVEELFVRTAIAVIGVHFVMKRLQLIKVLERGQKMPRPKYEDYSKPREAPKVERDPESRESGAADKDFKPDERRRMYRPYKGPGRVGKGPNRPGAGGQPPQLAICILIAIVAVALFGSVLRLR